MDEDNFIPRRRTQPAYGGGRRARVRFYTDEAPGRRLSPTMVLVMSLCFIGFVTAALYILGSGKLYRSRTAAAST